MSDYTDEARLQEEITMTNERSDVVMSTPGRNAEHLPTNKCIQHVHTEQGACYFCCDSCNYDTHICHGCGDPLTHDGKNRSGPDKGKKHEGCIDDKKMGLEEPEVDQDDPGHITASDDARNATHDARSE